MKTLFIISTVAMLCSNTAMAYGEAGRWSSGWGQGTSEYTAVVNEQNNLYIACNDTRKVAMTATVKGKVYGSDANQAFAIIINGERFDTPYETESEAGESSFHYMWDKLRDAKTITIETADAQQLVLPTQDVASALPATKTTEFDCLAWDETNLDSSAPTPDANPTPAALPSSAFDVSWRVVEYAGHPVRELQAVSHSDKITIQDAIVNRGNCVVQRPSMPKVLGFGEALKIPIGNCNILELRLVTNQGELLYQFAP